MWTFIFSYLARLRTNAMSSTAAMFTLVLRFMTSPLSTSTDPSRSARSFSKRITSCLYISSSLEIRVCYDMNYKHLIMERKAYEIEPTLSWSPWPHWFPLEASKVARIRMKVSLMSSLTATACVCARRRKVLTSILRSFAFFCKPLKWL